MFEPDSKLFLSNFHMLALVVLFLIVCAIGVATVIIHRADQPFPVRIVVGILFFLLGFPLFLAGLTCSVALRIISCFFPYRAPNHESRVLARGYARLQRLIFQHVGCGVVQPGWWLVAEALDLFKPEFRHHPTIDID